MATVLSKTLIVMAGIRTDADGPVTCFTFSQKPERPRLTVEDDLDRDEEVNITRPRRLQ